ncbi:hypothetical protein NVP1009O_10 [Vibrio phage 1.009.O._10N.261.51.C9]|nr:hypothetical protein NVP1009O_10 [Vibrio phage 1.009.O._10N.261.51.C9]
MASQITVLINDQDSFEIVRDRVAQILADESAGQMALATAQGIDPAPWDLKVYRERSIPWELLSGDATDDHAINVWFDSANVDDAAADVTNRQTFIGTINIDIIFGSVAIETADGYAPADRAAALGANRIMRLVRNMIMSDSYTYLGLRQTQAPLVAVGKRWVRSMNTFQPQLDNKTAQHIVGARLELSVRYSEFSPQYQPANVQILDCTVDEDSQGRVLAGAQFDYTPS